MKIAKLVVFLISLIGLSIFFLIASTRGVPFFCIEYDRECMKQYDNIAVFFQIFIPTISLSIITFFLRDEIFRAWLKFAYWWMPISIFFIFLSANAGGGGGWGIPTILDPEFVSFVFSSLFFIISLLIIITRSFSLRNQEKKEKLS